ncbi:MAG: Tm-1-like ATP-binding domain-containing protein [Planctomycetaceae bacterium]|nr:Tm-1-like ATP-binding domain-containing protein [Planctomycetaceae bacterium]
MTKSVYAVATMDTKGVELSWVASLLRNIGVSVKTVDIGTQRAPDLTPDVSREIVLGTECSALSGLDRGQAIGRMAEALRSYLVAETAAGRVAGVIGLGGSGGTSLITTAMRALPFGLPKLMVSTVASGNVGPYIDCNDITMMYSVVDVAGLNAVSEIILGNAARAMAGMVSHEAVPSSARPALGMTMFGVTTPCVDQVRSQLEADGYDCLVFHATGAGGRAMEQLVASGLISGVLDITTTEVADEVVGGVFPAGPHRFEKLLASRVPLVLSLGALDMVNFGAMDSVPAQFRHRKLHVHNSQVTLMRTSVEENRQIAAWIAEKLNQSVAPLTLLIPSGGVSLLDVPGQPFYDPEADAALFDELSKRLHVTDERQLIRLPDAINSPEFSAALVEHFRALTPFSE